GPRRGHRNGGRRRGALGGGDATGSNEAQGTNGGFADSRRKIFDAAHVTPPSSTSPLPRAPSLSRAAARLIGRPRGFEQEPGASLGLVDPHFQQACAGDVVVLVAQAVGLAHVRRQLLVVVVQLGE